MKKIVFITLAILLAAVLAACGLLPDVTGGDNDPPLTRKDGTDVTVSVNGGKSLNMPDPSGLDFDAIFGYAGIGTVWGEQSEEIKQQLIEAARENGFDVTFDENGCAILTAADGTQMKQNESGAWLPVSGTGDIPHFGGDWPDNEFTRKVPNPGFSILVANAEDDEFTAVFNNVTAAQIRAYVEKVKAAGFTVDAELEDQVVMDMEIYSYTASDRDGWTVSVSFASGNGSLSISKPYE